MSNKALWILEKQGVRYEITPCIRVVKKGSEKIIEQLFVKEDDQTREWHALEPEEAN